MNKFSQPKSCGYYIYLLGLISILLTSCSDPGMADLKKDVADIKAKENPHVEPIREYIITPPYFYEVQYLRDPFIAIIDTKKGKGELNLGVTQTDNQKIACPTPYPYRMRVGLEQMPLDALQMVGTIEKNGILWGLLVSKGDGIIYQVKQGDYMGENYGEIINITEQKIEVMEQLPDGKGCWKDEVATLSLTK